MRCIRPSVAAKVNMFDIGTEVYFSVYAESLI